MGEGEEHTDDVQTNIHCKQTNKYIKRRMKMSEREEKKIEASIPVQARVNIMGLANLDMYWEREGYNIRTISQLIGHSIELLCEILRANQKLERELTTIADANRYLNVRGLHQKSMRNRSFSKISKAIMFENMRAEGADPKIYATKQYNTLHRDPDELGRPTTTQPFTGKIDSEIIKKALDIYNNLEDESVKPMISQEFKMRDGLDERVVKSADAAEFVKVRREKVDLPLMKEKENSPDLLRKRIEATDAESQEELDRLNNLDFSELLKEAVKE